jgi:hypothetical protein
MKRIILILFGLLLALPCYAQEEVCRDDVGQLAMMFPIVGGAGGVAVVSPLYSFDFESGNFTGWTAQTGTPAVISSPGWTSDMGSYCMTSASFAAGYTSYTLSGGAMSPFWMTFFFAVNSLDVEANYGNLYLAYIYGASEASRISIGLGDSDSDHTIDVVKYLAYPASCSKDETFVPSLNTWYQMKIQVVDETGAGADGIINVWYRTVGGVWNQISTTCVVWDPDSGFEGITNIKLGRAAGTATGAHLVYIDNVQIAASDIW